MGYSQQRNIPIPNWSTVYLPWAIITSFHEKFIQYERNSKHCRCMEEITFFTGHPGSQRRVKFGSMFLFPKMFMFWVIQVNSSFVSNRKYHNIPCPLVTFMESNILTYTVITIFSKNLPVHHSICKQWLYSNMMLLGTPALPKSLTNDGEWGWYFF